MVGPDSRHHLFDRALRQADWTLKQLWLRTIGSGGMTTLLDLEAFLYGLITLPPIEQDVLASALNERLADLGTSVAIPYLVSPGRPGPATEDPLAVLEEHLQAANRRPPMPSG